MKKTILNEEIFRMRKMMGLNENLNDMLMNENPVEYNSELATKIRGKFDIKGDYGKEKGVASIADRNGTILGYYMTPGTEQYSVSKSSPLYGKPVYMALSDDNEFGKFLKNETQKTISEGTWEVDPTYTHFAVNKEDGKIYNGWQYDSDMDKESILHYCKTDLMDMDLNPKDFKVNSKKFLLGKGIDPLDSDNWVTNKMEEADPGEKMVSFDDLISQEDQAVIDAHDEEMANKYTRNDDDIESGNM